MRDCANTNRNFIYYSASPINHPTCISKYYEDCTGHRVVVSMYDSLTRRSRTYNYIICVFCNVGDHNGCSVCGKACDDSGGNGRMEGRPPPSVRIHVAVIKGFSRDIREEPYNTALSKIES